MTMDVKVSSGDVKDALPRKRIRVAVIDDHPLLRDGIVAAFDGQSELDIVALGDSADDALEIAERLLPELMFIDLSIPGDGIDAIRKLSLRFPAVRLAVLTMSDDVDTIKRAFLAGASAYLTKGISGAGLLEAAKSIASGDYTLPPAVAAALLAPVSARESAATLDFEFTDREREILSVLSRGRTNREIATAFSIPEATVRAYISNILRKVLVKSRVKAALLASSSDEHWGP